jgi:redox-sensitive bicupin YhaK (pirin superfamily)
MNRGGRILEAQEGRMKAYRIRDFFDPKFNEYIVGPKQTGSRGTYLVYGEVDPGASRRLSPGKGHEEILAVLSGSALLKSATGELDLAEGEAVYLDQDFEGELEAGADRGVRYLSSGGHVAGGHDH